MNGVKEIDKNSYFHTNVQKFVKIVEDKWSKKDFFAKFFSLEGPFVELQRVEFIAQYFDWDFEDFDKLQEIVKNFDLGLFKFDQIDYNIANHKEVIEKCQEFCENELFCLKSPHKAITSAEDFLEICSTPEKGRHMITTKDILPGTVLIVENPFVHSIQNQLDFQKKTINCSNCLQAINSQEKLEKCPNCPFLQFCTKKCLSQSEKFHNVECSVLPYLKLLDVNHLELLIFRSVISAMPEELLDLYHERKNSTNFGQNFILGTDPSSKIFDSSKYCSIYHWISHEDSDDFQIFLKFFKSLLFTKGLFHFNPNFYKNFQLPQVEILQFKLFISSLFARHMFNLPCNSYHIKGSTNFCPKNVENFCPKNVENLTQIDFAVGSYPLVGLINHTCDPNVAKFTTKFGKICIISTKSIKKGCEILTTYFETFADHDFIQRRKTLAQSQHFICKCVACLGQWPLKSGLMKIQPKILCPNANCCENLDKKGFCTKCRKIFGQFKPELAYMLNELNLCKDLVINLKPLEALVGLKKCLEFYQSRISQPNLFNLLADETFKNALILIINMANLCPNS